MRQPLAVDIVVTSRSGTPPRGCYAAALGDCSGSLSREHYLSHAVLRRMLADGGELHIGKTVWLSKGESRRVGSTSLTARVLCEAHNSALSPLDVIGERFCSCIIAAGDQGPPSPPHVELFNGEDLERWLLKTLCGVAAMEAAVRGSLWEAPVGWIEYLFKRTNDCPPGFGLYVDQGIVKLFPDGLSMAATPIDNVDGEAPLGLKFFFCGLTFVLMLGYEGRSRVLQYPIYRPGYLSIESQGHRSAGIAMRFETSPPGVYLRVRSREDFERELRRDGA